MKWSKKGKNISNLLNQSLSIKSEVREERTPSPISVLIVGGFRQRLEY